MSEYQPASPRRQPWEENVELVLNSVMTNYRRNRGSPQTSNPVAQRVRRLTLRNWMLFLAVSCQLATVLITWKVWLVRDKPMNLPLFPVLETMSESPVLNLTGPLLVASLILALIRPRTGVVVHAAIYLAACVFDLYRLQPQFFSLIVLMSACACDVGLWFARWYLAAMWLWTGIHKLFSSEWLGVESYAFLNSCGIKADGWNAQFAVLAGAAEVALGLLAIFAPRRAIPLCLAIHLGIMFALSPLLANHNESVWPWNFATAVVGAWILAQAAIARRPRNWLQYAVVMTLFVVPAGYYADWVNSRLCFVLYSGNLPRAMHCSSDRLRRLDGWTGLTVPFPNSPRLFVQVFDHNAKPGDKLYISDPRRWVSDRYFLKSPDGTVQEITRKRFYREVSDTGEVSGIEFDSRNAVWQLQSAGATLVKDGYGMVSSADLQGKRIGDREFRFLRQLPNLREVKMKNTEVTNRGLQTLAGLRRLEILEVEGGRLTNGCLRVVRQLPALNWLSLKDVAIDSNDVKQLRGLAQLHTLHLRDTGVDDRAFSSLATMRNLRWLDLSNSKIRGTYLGELESLGQLDWINFSGTAVGDDALANLVRFERLEIVQLSRTKISDRGLVYLSKLRQCRTLDLPGTNVTDAGLGHLAAMDRLQRLNLRGTKVTKQGVQQLRERLIGCHIQW